MARVTVTFRHDTGGMVADVEIPSSAFEPMRRAIRKRTEMIEAAIVALGRENVARVELRQPSGWRPRPTAIPAAVILLKDGGRVEVPSSAVRVVFKEGKIDG